jgi:cytochrome c556
MTTKTLAIVAIILWAGTAAAVGYKFVNGSTVIAADGRTAVVLKSDERTFVLGEMRAMLNAVEEVVAGVNAGDMEAIKKTAHRVGTAEAAAAPAAIMLKLPMDFKSLGMSVHEGFDELALAADKNPQAVMEALDANLAKCVACHETYRFGE